VRGSSGVPAADWVEAVTLPAKDDARCGIRVRAVRAEMDFHFRLLEGASPTEVHGRMRRFARTPRSPSGEIENTLQLPMRPANAVPMMVEARS